MIEYTWEPLNSRSWAKILGMVYVPMFGGRVSSKISEAAILLDGSRGSFAFVRVDEIKYPGMIEPLSWSWSSCVRHLISVPPSSDRLFIRRCDDPFTIRCFEIPSTGLGAVSLLSLLETAPLPRRPNVVQHVLEPFRQIRERIGLNESLMAVQMLNGLLLVAEKLQPRLQGNRIRGITTFKEAFSLLSDRERNFCGLQDIPKSISTLPAADLIQRIMEPDIYTGCDLYPSLLFRHAASRLYQEAHLEIERNPQGQKYLYGLEPTTEPSGTLKLRDVRFTPQNLARALVQKAFEAIQDRKRNLIILDPACGSAVFLIEAIRELTTDACNRIHNIKIVGYDISDISEYTSRFCLKYATNSQHIETEVRKCDSLDYPWVNADVILMNPPFIPWEGLSDDQRHKVGEILGDMAKQRPDIAMAFLTKAIRSLKPNGVIGCVLPASLLTNQTGCIWREWIKEEGDLRLIGCFEGFKYFPTSLVETAFLIFKKKSEGVDNRPNAKRVDILISEEGHEDAAIRALRMKPEATHIAGVEYFERPMQSFSSKSWRPLRRNAYEKKEHIANLALPRIYELFDIKQGIRTGSKQAFVLRVSQLKEINASERKYFRPSAGGGTIRNGQLHQDEYIFYPYDSKGNMLILSEDDLIKKLPCYYENYLKPNKTELAGRPRFKNRKWWELSEKRAWQATLSPRLISTYFGESGSFAFDEAGDYVTVNGHAWFWTNKRDSSSPNTQIPFEQTNAVWAYLAILNSNIFEDIISLFSVRLQGGQIRLESRFLSQVPLSDLTDEMNCPIEVVSELVKYGKAIHAGKLSVIASELNKCVSILYGLS